MKKQIPIIIFLTALIIAVIVTGIASIGKFRNSNKSGAAEIASVTLEPSSTEAAASEITPTIEVIELPIENEDFKSAPKKIIVLDPGHGMTSDEMSDEEKANQGWTHTDKGWGEWRHWKTGSRTEDCEGYGCSGRAPENGSCWYPIANGDRDGEGDINLRNVMYAKQYLEEMGYEVRLTRDNNSNPSMTKRLESCYPDGGTEPDADAFVCIHSNAGGGSGSAYIEMSGVYDQYGISESYADDGNRLGQCINSAIVENTSLGEYSGGTIELPELILFCKSPITIAYLEIGFFDNAGDMAILDSEAEAIGRSIAEGIDAYFNG